VEFYVDTGGDNTNGGSDSGTSAKATYANVDATDNGSGDHDLDNNNGGAGWGTTAVGDWICYDTAGNKEFAEVKALSVGGDDDVINVLTLSEGSLTDLTAVSVNVGGAWATPKHAIETLEVYADIYPDAGSPFRINVKTGTYSNASTITLTNSLHEDKPLIVQGYVSTIGDHCVGGTRPIIEHDTTGNLLTHTSSKNHYQYRDIHFKRINNSLGHVVQGPFIYGAFERCKIEKTQGASNTLYNVGVHYVDCEIVESGSATSILGGFSAGAGRFMGCTFDGPLAGCRTEFIDCVLDNLQLNIVSLLWHCTLKGRAGKDTLVTYGYMNTVYNCIIAGAPAGYYGLQMGDATQANLTTGNNLFYDNDTDKDTIPNYDDTNDVSGDPDLDADDIPSSTSAAKAQASNAYRDIGARQHEDSGGGGVSIVNTRRNSMIGR